MSIREYQLTVSNITVDVVKKDIKNMHLTVYPPNGRVRVSAPSELPDEAVRLFVVGKIHWIKKRQKLFQEQQRELPREYITGESHFFDGKRYLLKVIDHSGKAEIKIKNKKYLELYVRSGADKESKQRVFTEFYRNYLKATVPALLKKWEEITGLQCESWEIRKMQTKWGSCNEKKKKIILNLELAKKPRPYLEYIILHELLHLLVRNHNDEFRALLDRYMPNWREYQRELNALPVAGNEIID